MKLSDFVHTLAASLLTWLILDTVVTAFLHPSKETGVKKSWILLIAKPLAGEARQKN